MLPIEHHYVKTNGITLHVVQAGPADGRLLILLHGFPEFWYGWRKQIQPLAEAGFRLWIPDQRGYNLSDKPAGIAAYNLDETAADVVGLIEAAGEEQALVVGHDWGGAAAWWLANKHPERVHKLGILNVPHHAVMNRHMRRSVAQLRKSWYFFFFQLPWLPEAAIKANGAATLRGSSRPGAFSDDDLAQYKQAWGQPGALTGMINWYRAILRVQPGRLPSPRIKVPTLMIWGKQDGALGHEMAQPSIELCEDGRLIFIEEATHWVQHEAAEQVNQHLIQFLSEA